MKVLRFTINWIAYIGVFPVILFAHFLNIFVQAGGVCWCYDSLNMDEHGDMWFFE